MDPSQWRKPPERKDNRVIIHFDYDCFYAAVFEAANPALKLLPLAVQQKQIIVTCNYEARRRGLHKLQLITEAKRICPDVIIVLGEDISRFRDASKELYGFLAPFSWSGKVERLGFDEVWFDVTDVVDYNVALLNRNHLVESFFQLDMDDPTQGFAFDATLYAGHTYPAEPESVAGVDEAISLRMKLGSHLAMHMRRELEHHRGYTATVGIATSKLLSKLAGNLNKPNGQTTLVPPLGDFPAGTGNATAFLDGHDIGKVPSIGFKMAQKLRAHVLQRDATFDAGLVYGGTKEHVTVRDVRLFPGLHPEKLEQILSGPGAPHGIGAKVWALLHAVDDSEVAQARAVPRQISIEDSYIRLDSMGEVLKELKMLSLSLLNRMRVDLLGDGDLDDPAASKRWLAHPKTLRLSTRPRPPLNADGTRTRSFKRISHSAPLPNFVFSLTDRVEALAEKLVVEALVPMFKRLHPERQGWNLSLVNIAVTNMMETGGESKTAVGRDIGGMFRRQEDVLKDFRVVEESEVEDVPSPGGNEAIIKVAADDRRWDEEDETEEYFEEALPLSSDGQACGTCGLVMPPFALVAHERFHQMGD